MSPVHGRRSVLSSLVAVAALFGVAACAADSPTGTSSPSGPTTTSSPTRSFTVRVVAHAGPTCPVERPDEPCPDSPVVGTVNIEQLGALVAAGRTDATGTYTGVLPPGAYRVTVDAGAPLPRCEPVDVAVIDRDVTVDVSCDTGIR